MLHRLWVALALHGLLLLLWPSSSLAVPTSTQEPPVALIRRNISSSVLPSLVFRGDRRAPNIIKIANGFLPHSALPPKQEQAYGLFNHVVPQPQSGKPRETIYVSTTADESIAELFGGKSGWVYLIHATPNFIDANGSLGKWSQYHHEMEFTAAGGIHWSQVLAWRKVGSRDLVENKDYEHKWDQYRASPGQPQLAGFKESGFWMRALREPWWTAVGWFTPLQTHACRFLRAQERVAGWNPTKYGCPVRERAGPCFRRHTCDW